MTSLLQRLFGADPGRAAARDLYEAAVAAARRPELYRDYRVADSLDGRFDLIVVHVFLVLQRLRREGEAGRDLGQRVCDLMFDDMDRSLRELGVGDLGVGRRVQRMATAMNGRIAAYEAALGEVGDEALAAALGRNVYRGEAAADGNAPRLADYVRRQAAVLAAQEGADLLRGEARFAPPLGRETG